PIEDRGLAGCDCALRFIELNRDLPVIHPYSRGLRLEPVANLDLAANGPGELLDGAPVVIPDRKALFMRVITNDDAVQLGFDANNIRWTSRSDEPLALADGVPVNSAVRSDNLSALCDDRARLTVSCLPSGILLHEVGIRTAFH